EKDPSTAHTRNNALSGLASAVKLATWNLLLFQNARLTPVTMTLSSTKAIGKYQSAFIKSELL
ncbi:hypothetical protein, partial [Salmonella enterica]|uniref:hypothetical protein n=1 Tax=Salmonella enterica TaxID=28901 RepID=UPI001BB08727